MSIKKEIKKKYRKALQSKKLKSFAEASTVVLPPVAAAKKLGTYLGKKTSKKYSKNLMSAASYKSKLTKIRQKRQAKAQSRRVAGTVIPAPLPGVPSMTELIEEGRKNFPAQRAYGPAGYATFEAQRRGIISPTQRIYFGEWGEPYVK